MKYVELGRTGTKVSVVGLGCGGQSRLGMARGNDAAAAAAIVRSALDLGITFVDTAENYGTEEAVGLGVRGRRDEVFISTKTNPAFRNAGGGLLTPADLRKKVDASLKRLGTDRIDLFNLHGVDDAQYDHSVDVLLPELKRLQEEGKIRFLGITESFGRDTDHQMLRRALPDAHFDVVMVGFNLLNPSARRTVLPLTQRHRIGTLVMFAVRRALSRSDALREMLRTLETEKLVPPGTADEGLDFVVRDPDVHSLVEAGYRFCRHEPGADVILTGTGNHEHLRENVGSILGPPLAPRLLDRLTELFGELETVSGN